VALRESTKPGAWLGWVALSAALHVLLALLLPRAWDDPEWAQEREKPRSALTLSLLAPVSAREADPDAGGSAAGPTAPATAQAASRPPPIGDLVAVLGDRARRSRDGEREPFFSSGGGAGGLGGRGDGRGAGSGPGSRDGVGGGPVLERLPWPKYPEEVEERITRTVRVRVLVASDGSVRSADLEPGQASDAFAEEALHTARLARFRASLDRVRGDRWVVLPITFHP